MRCVRCMYVFSYLSMFVFVCVCLCVCVCVCLFVCVRMCVLVSVCMCVLASVCTYLRVCLCPKPFSKTIRMTSLLFFRCQQKSGNLFVKGQCLNRPSVEAHCTHSDRSYLFSPSCPRLLGGPGPSPAPPVPKGPGWGPLSLGFPLHLPL